MGTVFDGNKYATKLEKKLKDRVVRLGKSPSLGILMVGDSHASLKYVEKKKEVGERVGVKVEVRTVEGGNLENEIKEVASRVDGVMVQLPVPGMTAEQTAKILAKIPLDKDVDGLNPENLKLLADGSQTFVPATVKAVGKILDEALREIDLDILQMKVAVVGAEGTVGSGVVAQMERFSIEVLKLDVGDDLGLLRDMDVVVSATGKSGLIKPDMVKEGVVAIDVGFPGGDFEKEVVDVAGFFTPVPGGVGPVTVISLIENVVQAAE